jgi:inner membrane protein
LWIWLGLAALFLIAELTTNLTYTLWLAVAAGLTGAITLIAPGLPVEGQLVVFAALAISVTVAGRRWFKPRLELSPEALAINAPSHRLLGATAVAVADFSGGAGRVRHGDTEWAASTAGPDPAAGDILEVVAVNGATLDVRQRQQSNVRPV